MSRTLKRTTRRATRNARAFTITPCAETQAVGGTQ